jgi:hypothetical protein
MAEIKTMRALQSQMREAAKNLGYDFGTGLNGEVVYMGYWPWGPENDKQLPELPPLMRDATPRQRRDHRFAENLRTQQPAALLKALMACRQVIGEVVQAEIDLREEGYAGKALDKMRLKLGEELLAALPGAVGGAFEADQRLTQIRRDLTGEVLKAGNVDNYLKSLGFEGAESESDPPAAETQVAVQTAIFDAEIARALKPLSAAEKTSLAEGRELPKHLDDPRVLAAIFRVPAALLPFDGTQMSQIAGLAFARNWPKAASASRVVSAMVEAVRPVAGTAILMAGRLIDPVNPYDTFRRLPGGRWALEPLVATQPPAAREVYNDLCVYARAG